MTAWIDMHDLLCDACYDLARSYEDADPDYRYTVARLAYKNALCKRCCAKVDAEIARRDKVLAEEKALVPKTQY